MMTDEDAFKILRRLAEIDTRFLHEALADYRAAIQMYGFELTEAQWKQVEDYVEEARGKTDDEILAQLRQEIIVYRP